MVKKKKNVKNSVEEKVEVSMNSSTYYTVQTKTPPCTYRATGPLTLGRRECKMLQPL